MATGVLLTPPIVQFFSNAGLICANGSVLTQVGGINAATYADVNLITPLPNPIPLNSRGDISTAAGASSQCFLTPNTVYVFTLFDGPNATGNQLWQATYVNGIQVSASSIGQLLYPRTASEIAAGVTPVNFAYPPGDSRRNGITFDSGVTDNKSLVQNWLNGNPGTTLYLYGVTGAYAKLTDGVTCPPNTSIVGVGYPNLTWSAITRTGTTAMGVTTHPGIEILVAANVANFSMTGCVLTGPSVGTFTAGETGILCVGASAASRGQKWYVEDCEILQFGQFAVLTEYMQNIVMRKCKNHDCGYSGGTHGSGLKILHEFNEIYNITPGSGGNAYGDNFTHNSLNYNIDPMVNSPITAITQAASLVATINIVSGTNPFSIGQVVSFFLVAGMNQLNGLAGAVSAIGGSSGAWTVTVGINSTGFSPFLQTGTISGITLANPCVVTISNASTVNPYTVGQQVSFAGIVGTTQLNGTSAYISAIGGTSGAWTLTLGNVNSSAFTAWVSGGTTNTNAFMCCPRQAVHPFCIDVVSRNNLVYDIPLWSGIDFHGAYDSCAENNETYNCYIHVQLSGSSGNAIAYAGENNTIKNNRCNYNRKDGSAATIATARGSAVSYGINTVGGTAVFHRNVVVEGNTINGPMGDPTGFGGTTFVFGLQYTQNLSCINNTILGWNGIGMYVSHTDGVISNNTFGPPSTAANSGCVYAAGYCGELTIVGNKHSPAGGQSAASGMDVNTLGMPRITVNNDFQACTSPYGANLAFLSKGYSDLVPRINDATTGSHTIDLSVLGVAPRVLLTGTQGSAATITDFVNGTVAGQEVDVLMIGTNTLSIQGAAAGGGGHIKTQGGGASINLTSASAVRFVRDQNGIYQQAVAVVTGNT